MARKLLNIEPDEISLVDRAANKKKFAITKQERKIMKELIEKINKFLGEGNQLTTEEIAKVEKIDPERGKELGKALDTFQSYEGELNEDFESAAVVLVKSAIPEDVEPVELDEKGVLSLFLEKAGAALSKATRGEINKIKAIVDKMLEAKTEKVVGKNADLPEDVVAKLEKLDELEEADKDRIKKAEKDKEDKQQEVIEDLQKSIEKLNDKLKDQGDTTQIKDDGDTGDPKVKKGDKEFQWKSFNPKK